MSADEGSEDDSDENDENDEDREQVRRFIRTGCGCSKMCHKNFSFQEIYMHRLHVKEMDNESKDMYVMGVVNKECVFPSDKTKHGRERKRAPAKDLYFKGTKVCRKAFLVCFAIGKKYLNTISSHVKTKGVIPRMHGNTGRKAHNAFSYNDVKRIVEYIKNFADEKGLPQPAAPRGRDNIPPIFLPSDTTKKEMHEEYVSLCRSSSSGFKAVSLTLFKNIWSNCVPHIRIAGPREDVCARCEKLRQHVMDARTEPEKLEATTELRDHILVAQNERELYNECIKKCKEDPDYTHYTFDFSQNVALPHRSRQIGPLFFLTLRKVQLFGFRIDGIPRQLNFLIDEDQTIGSDGKDTHGPNAVLSMLDWALQTYGSNKPRFSIHSDNCPGQNKNKYTMGYFMWRVMTAQSTEIEFLMQTPGHARCHVDAGFANVKKLFRRSDCETLGQLENIVNKSSMANLAVRYPQWSWRNWKQFLDGVFKPMKNIS
ncbi:uncharacterized protein LOC123532084 [Mercenaria mercenaria]|uniref:uncharacterized protein LOC123532084 n=1 Tax=Mercenaria mercenaria TaxID=6596 RepID=UPI00234F7103|nr:uncharacterized protein LOC123532084 [Mercenaria mercenaria]